MMMLAQQATAKAEPELTAAGSRAILLLDFQKAYDTVSREFRFLALERFEFSHEFTEMIWNIHEGTTAQFVVDEELSQPQKVVSEIWQWCPFAPLFFLVVAGMLVLAIQQDSGSSGLPVPRKVKRDISFPRSSTIRRCFCRRPNI